MSRFKSILHLLQGARIHWRPHKECVVCGRRMPLLQLNVITQKLSCQWELNEKWLGYFQEREGLICTGCGSARRSIFLAEGILEFARKSLGIDTKTFKKLVTEEKFKKLKVAELNSLGSLHRFLKTSPNLYYSEYGSKNPKIRSEDLLDLSYGDNAFDWVLHSETLEHVPNFQRSLMEIYRVLKPGGVCIFTIPVVLDGRNSRTRARLNNGSIAHDLPASYHGMVGEEKSDYLVFHEFGEDCLDEIQSYGFEISMIKDSINPALVCFFAVKPQNEADNEVLEA